jgi:hypothetical protein
LESSPKKRLVRHTPPPSTNKLYVEAHTCDPSYRHRGIDRMISVQRQMQAQTKDPAWKIIKAKMVWAWLKWYRTWLGSTRPSVQTAVPPKNKVKMKTALYIFCGCVHRHRWRLFKVLEG